jgi:protein SCO1/2
VAERQLAFKAAPAFDLVSQDGKRVRLRDLEGSIVLLSFIYTTCIDYCPLITADLLTLRSWLQNSGVRNLRLVFITTDPEVDSPEVLKAYAKRYRAESKDLFFLTGPPAPLRKLWGAYGVKVVKKARGLVDHTLLTVLIDAKGRIRRRYLGGRLEPGPVLADVDAIKDGK